MDTSLLQTLNIIDEFGNQNQKLTFLTNLKTMLQEKEKKTIIHKCMQSNIITRF